MNVQQQTPEVRHEAVAAQSIHGQTVLQFIIPLFTGSPLNIFVVTLFGLSIGGHLLIGDDEAKVGSVATGFCFRDDGS